MGTRNQWPSKFSGALDEIQHEETWQHAYDLVSKWLLESLEPTQRTIYYFIEIQFHDKTVTAAEVAYAYHLKPNHAATILKGLYDLRLLKRKMFVDKATRYYVYWK